MTFGERLKYLRDKTGMSQGELAKRFNLSQSTIAYYEVNKKQPSHSTLKKMADFFDVSIDWLLIGTEKPSKLSMPYEWLEKKQTYNDFTTTVKLLEEQANKLGLKPSDPEFLEMLNDAFDLLKLARGKNKE